jgi:hypothetical protein
MKIDPKGMHCENGGGWTRQRDHFRSRASVQAVLKVRLYYKRVSCVCNAADSFVLQTKPFLFCGNVEYITHLLGEETTHARRVKCI